MIKRINSIKNDTVKLITSLSDKKNILKHGLTFLEGEKVVLDAINASLPVVSVFVSELKLNYFLFKLENVKNKNFEIIEISSDVAQKISNTVTTSGVFALIKLPEKKEFDVNKNFLVLDTVQDPTNVGALMRSALAFSFTQIILVDSVFEYLPKVIRSSMGYVFSLNTFSFTKQEFIEFAKKHKLQLISANLKGENLNKFNKPNGAFGLVAGNEGQGISKEIEDLSTHFVSIPMQNGVESLNVSVSISIIMNHLTNN